MISDDFLAQPSSVLLAFEDVRKKVDMPHAAGDFQCKAADRLRVRKECDAEKTKIRRVELHFDSSRNTCEATGVLSWLMVLFQFWGRNCLTLRSSRSS